MRFYGFNMWQLFISSATELIGGHLKRKVEARATIKHLETMLMNK